MPRSASGAVKADETVTVRLPFGTAAKVRAATGQPFSTVVRWMVVQLLNRYTQGENVKETLREQVQTQIGDSISGN
jgi:hypothetical protein